MGTKRTIILSFIVLVLVLSLSAVGRLLLANRAEVPDTPASAAKQTLIAVNADHVAIQGYDTVAYFTNGIPAMGSNQFVYFWNNARWQFSSAAHRDMFAANPEHYMPQYGGYCASSMVQGWLTVANPEAWTIVDGKLYMFAESKHFGGFNAADITQADDQWRSKTGQ
jgi:hypothetical protein